MHTNLKKLIKKYHGKIVRFKDLSVPEMLAIALYMSVDGEAWGFPNDNWRNHKFFDKADPSLKDREKYDRYLLNVLKRSLKCFYISQYGSFKVGTVNIPTIVLAEKIVKNHRRKWSVDEYKDWLKKGYDVPNYPLRNRWPVILDDYEGSIIQDGWHRFSLYLTRGDELTPCIYFV